MSDPNRGQAGRALVVENDAVIAIALRDLLLSLGFAPVDIAHTAEEALTAAHAGAYAVAALDIKLERGDSFPAAAVLRGRGVPIVFATAAADASRLPAAFAGAPVLLKPYTDEALREALARAAAPQVAAP